MRRRDFVKGVVAAPLAAQAAFGQQSPSPAATPAPPPGLAPAPPPAAPAARAGGGFAGRGRAEFVAPPVTSVVPDAVAAPELGFFTGQQFAALRRLSDLLMPPLDGNPGALMAEAPEFLDFYVSASFEDTQQLYRTGLDHLNADARRKFGAAFADLNDKQADAIVRPGLKPWMQWHPPTEPFANFIAVAYDDIRKATMNSEAWSLAAQSSGGRNPGAGLFWYPIDPDMKKWI